MGKQAQKDERTKGVPQPVRDKTGIRAHICLIIFSEFVPDKMLGRWISPLNLLNKPKWQYGVGLTAQAPESEGCGCISVPPRVSSGTSGRDS